MFGLRGYHCTCVGLRGCYCGLLHHYDGGASWVSTLVEHARRLGQARREGKGALVQAIGRFGSITILVQVDADVGLDLIDTLSEREALEWVAANRYALNFWLFAFDDPDDVELAWAAVLRWKGIEATEKLAQSENAKVVVVGSGPDGLPLILGGAN